MRMQPSEARRRLYDHEARLLKHAGHSIFGAVHQFRPEVDEQIRDTPAETRQNLEAVHQQALKERKNLGWIEHLTPILTSTLLLAGTAAGALLGPAGVHGPLIGGITGFALSFFPAMVAGWGVGEKCQEGRLHNNENRYLAMRVAAQAAEQLELQPDLPLSDLTISEKLERYAQAKYDLGNFGRGAEYMNAAEIYQPFQSDYLEMRHHASYLPASQLVVDETAPDAVIPPALPLSSRAQQYDQLRVQKNALREEGYQREHLANQRGAVWAGVLTVAGGLAGAALGCWPVGLLMGAMGGGLGWSQQAQLGENQRQQLEAQIDQLSARQEEIARD